MSEPQNAPSLGRSMTRSGFERQVHRWSTLTRQAHEAHAFRPQRVSEATQSIADLNGRLGLRVARKEQESRVRRVDGAVVGPDVGTGGGYLHGAPFG